MKKIAQTPNGNILIDMTDEELANYAYMGNLQALAELKTKGQNENQIIEKIKKIKGE